jgi:magnesium transporter
MKALAVVSAIFLPLTLIASIYGTNLDYSAVFGWHLEGGFYVMIAAMLLMAVSLVAYFRYRRWL